MTGEDLYNLWAEAMKTQGVEVDDWVSMDERTQAAWETVAEQVQEIP